MKYGEYNIYVIENDAHKVKIGITTNFQQRLQSLSGSNTGGNKIINYWCSEKTYLYTLERHFHDKYERYRIKGTEWFYRNENKENFYEEIKNDISEIFMTEQYRRLNECRKNFNARKSVIRIDSLEQYSK